MVNKIEYKLDIVPGTEQVIELYRNCRLNRPTEDFPRISMMYQKSNLIITAWKNNQLIGVSRALTDHSFCCYLSDLAVRKEYQPHGIGRKIVDLTRKEIGPQCMLILLSSSTAMNYYPKIGFDNIKNAFLLDRTV